VVRRSRLGIDEDEIELARRGTSANPAFAAMIEYAVRVYRAPDEITDEHIGVLRSHGFSDREIADVVGLGG